MGQFYFVIIMGLSLALSSCTKDAPNKPQKVLIINQNVNKSQKVAEAESGAQTDTGESKEISETGKETQQNAQTVPE